MKKILSHRVKKKFRKKYEKPIAESAKISLEVWGGSSCCGGSCLSSSTKILTPFGQTSVRNLKKGDLVLTRGEDGSKIIAPILKTSKVFVSTAHHIVRLVLLDGRKLFVSPDHPAAGRRNVCQLEKGQQYDNSIIVKVELIPYKRRYTYDILPAGKTGYYWANNILMASTLKNQVSEDKKLHRLKSLHFLFHLAKKESLRHTLGQDVTI